MIRIVYLLALLIVQNAFGQADSVAVKALGKNVVSVIDGKNGTRVVLGDTLGIEVVTTQKGDTTTIRIGRRNVEIVEKGGNTRVEMSREPKVSRPVKRKFNGLWGGFELGINTLHTVDYDLYSGTSYGRFFEIDHPKSLSVNINFAEYAFSNESNTVGLVTGLGISMMDYRFSDPITVKRSDNPNYLIPVVLSDAGLVKSKLNVAYLTAPMMLQVATPLKYKQHRLTLGGGVIGGVNIGSHTKIKSETGKTKERRNFNVHPVKYDLTARVGLGEVSLFVNYAMTPVFTEGKGPLIQPLTAGITILNF